MPRWRRCSPSARVGCGPRVKRAPWGTAASAWSNGRRAFRGRRFSGACGNLRPTPSYRRNAPVGPGAGANRRLSSMQRCCAISRPWSSPPRPVIRTRRCAGPARALGRWRSRSERWVTRSATPWSPNCCTSWATPFKATSRRGRAGSIPIGMRSFGISPRRCSACSGKGNRPSRWIRRRRSWSAISRIAAERGGARASPTASRARLHHS